MSCLLKVFIVIVKDGSDHGTVILGNWAHWNTRVDPYYYPTDSDPEFSTILVPNVDNILTDYLIKLVGKQEKAVLLTGEQGTAKTAAY